MCMETKHHLLCKSFSRSNDQTSTNSTTDGCSLSARARFQPGAAPTNHSNMSRLKCTLQLNMVGVIQTTLSPLLNLAIFTELPCDSMVRVFLDLGGLLHCVFDAQRFALTRKKPREEIKIIADVRPRRRGGRGGIKWEAKSGKYTALEKDKQQGKQDDWRLEGKKI